MIAEPAVLMVISLSCLVAAGLFTRAARRRVPGPPHLGAALVTGIVAGSGNLGVLIYLLEKGTHATFVGGWPVLLAMGTGVVALPLGAGAAGREERSESERAAALGWFVLTALALLAAVATGAAFFAATAATPTEARHANLLFQAVQPVGGVLVLGLLLQQKLVVGALRARAVSRRGVLLALLFGAALAGGVALRLRAIRAAEAGSPAAGGSLGSR
jgi:hypothetical protein